MNGLNRRTVTYWTTVLDNAEADAEVSAQKL